MKRPPALAPPAATPRAPPKSKARSRVDRLRILREGVGSHRGTRVAIVDMQMPKMDDLEASRAIRAKWKPDERPRIVAMTPNAMQGDNEACIAAGMDDYVTKPIRVDALVQALTSVQPRTRDD